MSDKSLVFQGNTQAGAMLVATLMRGMSVVLTDIEKTLKTWGQEWKRKVQRVSPVESGRMRQSWFTEFERTNQSMSITLANSITGKDGGPGYPVYIEFGTDRIAHGRVKAWQPGEPPIMSWPAKNADLPAMPRFGTAAYERYENTLSKAFTAGAGEQMPMLRPTGYEIAPKVIEDVQQAVVQGFQSVVNKRSS